MAILGPLVFMVSLNGYITALCIYGSLKWLQYGPRRYIVRIPKLSIETLRAGNSSEADLVRVSTSSKVDL